MSISEHMVMNHFTTVLLVILCGIKLHSQKKARDVEMRYFWVTLLSCFLLAIQDAMETYAATDPDLRFWRIAAREGCTAILGCDAHQPRWVTDPGSEAKAVKMAEDLGLPLLREVSLRPLTG